MNNKDKAAIIRLAKYLLNDQYGISADAYQELLHLLYIAEDDSFLYKVKQTENGRYYIPVGEL